MRYPAPNAKARALGALALVFLVIFVLDLTAGHYISSSAVNLPTLQSNSSNKPINPLGLDGRVVDILTGEPIAGAKVEAAGLATKTDAAGHFHLSLPPGVYDVYAVAPTYIGMTLLGRPVRSGEQPPLLFEMVPAHPTEAEAKRIDRKLLAAPGVPGPREAGQFLTAVFQTDVTEVPRTIRVLMPNGTIVAIDTDEYLRGVVPVEIGPYRPVEALKAQAVAARSYAATRCLPQSAGDPNRCEPGLDANVDTTTATQVWDPVRRYDTTDEAVHATHGVVPRYNGKLIESLFFSHSDGRTRSSEEIGWGPRPYLRSVVDPVPFTWVYGHGVGLSQHGAIVLADWGSTFDEILRYYYTGVTVAPQQPPRLTAPLVAPADADSHTPVRFEITYADPEGDPPVAADVYIDGYAYPMQQIAGGGLRTGARFAYTTTLGANLHTYDFHFSDGFAPPVTAAGGRIDVAPATGPAPTSTPPTEQTRGGQWRHSSRLDWLTGTLDGLAVTAGEDAALTLTEDTKAAAYTSTVLEAGFPFIAIGANWQADLPRGTEMVIQVQASPDNTTWSEWVTLPPGDGGRWAPLDNWSDLAFVAGRYLRYRITLSSPDPKTLRPRLDGITLTYIDVPARPAPDVAASLAQDEEPPVILRDEWCDNCSEPTDWPPEYETPVKFIVHHTVSPNGQDGYEAVQAIYYYHAVTRGWGDIGYNFLIDSQGRIFEGRYGGEQDGKTVVGGHALQFNYGSIGVALIGTFSEEAPPSAMVDSLVEFLAWRGVQYNIDPYDDGPLAGEEFPYGILGHRDVLPDHTVCPGQAAYDLLPDIRRRVSDRIAELGGLKTPTPTVSPTATATLPPGCEEGISNGGFELDDDDNNQPDDWTPDEAIWSGFAPHSGQRAIFLGLTNSQADTATRSEIWQTVSLPADVTRVQLSFWHYTSSEDVAGDMQYVELRDAEGEIISRVWAPAPPANNGDWRQETLDLTSVLAPHHGTEVQFVFGVANDGDGVGKTYMRVDDVALQVCHGTATPTPVVTGSPTITPAFTSTPTATSTATLTATPTPTPIQQAVVRAGGGIVDASGIITIPVEALGVQTDRLGATTIEIRYAPTVLDVAACTPDPDSRFDYSLCNPEFDNDGAKPDAVRFNMVSAAGVSGDLRLAEIAFRAVGQAGRTSPLDVVIQVFAAPSGNEIPAQGQAGEICITSCPETPTPTATLSPTPTLQPTPTPSPPPSNVTCREYIGNPSFEDDTFWALPNTSRPARYSTTVAHSGARSMLLGILPSEDDVYSYSSASQQIPIPADAVTVTLSFWYYPISEDLEDRQIVEVWEPNREVRNRLAGIGEDTLNEQEWIRRSFDLTEHYPGRTMRLYFSVLNRNQETAPGDVTSMYVDDVSVIVCRPRSAVWSGQVYLPFMRR